MQYILQDDICGNSNDNETHIVRDWLNDFGIDELEEYSTMWQELIMFAGELICNITDEKTKELIADAIAIPMYLNFNISEDYVPQAKHNYAEIKELLEECQ